MLALAARWQGHALRQLLPAACQAAQLQQERGMKLFEIFSKEERAKRKAKLKEEMQRGYFDDFRDFRDSKGKVFAAPQRLAPASHAPAFPRMQVLLSNGSPSTFPPAATAAAAAAGSGGSEGSSSGGGGELQPAAASLVCLAFRAGAQPMLEAWAGGFSSRFQGRRGVALYELAIVEGVVMSMWPFKQLLLRNSSKAAAKYALPCRVLTHFGAMDGIRAGLHLTNLLTGYVFLVDAQGRLRWRASGSPSEQELQTLLRVTEELLREQGEPALPLQQAQQRAGQQQQAAVEGQSTPQQQAQPS
ncbi:hypothetical protein ABPG75_013760 [Micractinium tetrahymenae]